MSLFNFVYGVEPLSPLDLMPQAMGKRPNVEAIERVEEIKSLHE